MNSNWSYSPETLNSGPNRCFFVPCDLQMWWMTLTNNRAPLPSYFKLCVTFQSHRWIQTWGTVQKRSIRVKIGDFFVPCDLEIWRMILNNYMYRALSYAASSFVHHFIAINAFKLELQCGNAQFGGGGGGGGGYKKLTSPYCIWHIT